MTSERTGWIRRTAFDPQLERQCEILELDTRDVEGARRLADVRRVAAEMPPWTQTVVRIEDDRPGWVRVSTTVLDGTLLLEHIRTAPVVEAMHALDQLLAHLDAAHRSELAPRRLTDAVISEGSVLVPLVDLLHERAASGLRPDLCVLLGALGSRADVPERVHGVLEAFDRDLFDDVNALRAALTRATTPWHRRHRFALGSAALLVILLALGSAYAAWTHEVPLDDIIKDDLNARVEQMHALQDRADVVPHGEGPDLGGLWHDEDGAPTHIEPTGAPEAGGWLFESGTLDRAPDAPGYWRHHGVLTLRTIEGRYFLSGSLARDPGGEGAWVDVELELRPDDRILLRSSVFHDPGVGYSFAYFLGSFRRAS